MRIPRAFAFVDLSGFTRLTEVEGDEYAVSILGTFRTMLRGVCSRRGVRIAKWLGDGAMIVGVETTPLIEATLEVHHRVHWSVGASAPFEVRSGAAAGEVILLEGDDYIGRPVNIAARLCDLADSGEVLADASVAADLPKWGTTTSSSEVALRGLERPLSVVRLGMKPLVGLVAPDPVCGIPLTHDVAESIARDSLGDEIWFCSESCRDTWERRPRPADELGSLRTPLIES